MPTYHNPDWPYVLALALAILTILFWRYSVHERKKRIRKGLEALRSEAETIGERITDYVSAVNTLIARYRADKTDFMAELKLFKGVVNTLFLPPINLSRVGETAVEASFHNWPELYHGILFFAADLSDFRNQYMTFFVKVNANFIDDLTDFASRQYHATATILPDAEYLKNTNTEKNADRAIDYFEDFVPVVHAAQQTIEELVDLLPKAIRQNWVLPFF